MASNMDMLHESLLLVIISLLPFKEAARTCVLSKRWMKIWHSTKNIEFNELFFVKPGESDETRRSQRMVFLNFITHWIEHYTNRFVDKFSLTVSDPGSCRETVERCVAFATQHGVKGLSLDFSDPKWEENIFEDRAAMFQLPAHVYGLGSSLESLKLYSCSFAMPHLLTFRGLKDVSLGWIEVSIATVRTLLSTCKMIESLSLEKCRNLEDFYLGEEELGLRKLVVDKCYFKNDYFRFTAPKLTFFKFSGEMWISDIEVRPHDMGLEADIDFAFETQFQEYGDHLCKLLQDLYPVRVLTVCSFLLQTIPSGEEPVRIQFDMNVRHLTMKTQLHPHELIGFMFLLNSCPMLEKLTLEIDPRLIFSDYTPPYPCDLTQFWEGRKMVPRCLWKTLKVVEIKGCRTTMDELVVCHFFIKAGRVLEEIDINLFQEEDRNIMEARRARVQRTIQASPKASKNLRISIA